MSSPKTVLALASYFKGNRFLETLKAEGTRVYLLTIEACLPEAWPSHCKLCNLWPSRFERHQGRF